ncbi:HlyD family secretion protein [Actinospica sp.]|jgi:multidrug resistance efflux pump|uniref:HlyD family secretion protein n=1 Tax=Actinospica sp. TaxID=1872142 RepID=UPI002BA0BC9B|nr:biotin/lipoyl-binding protein [Actinospica sp.]HWG26811.1 biotin/lipoyl-binding protein [Actinospica sp.]
MAKRIRARGMNAALASGEAGVGEMTPARSPLRPKQFGVALAAAVVGSGLGMFTYHAVSATTTAYSGLVSPTQTYYLNFAADGTVLALDIKPGQHVTKGQVLATQDGSVAQAQLSAAQAAATADAAVVAAEQNPQATASTAAADALSVSQAQSAVSAAQNALSVQQSAAQHTVSTQSSVVTSAQNAFQADSSRYATDCSSTATSSTTTPPPTTADPTEGSPSASSTESAAKSGAATSATSPASGAQQEQYCANLQSTINRDSTTLSSAQAELANVQSSVQLEGQRDSSNLTSSQNVLTAAAARQEAATAPVTAATIDQAKAQLATAQAQVATDQQALQNTKILAPSDGVIAETAGAVGEVVGPSGVHGYQGPGEQSGTQSNGGSGFELFVPQTGGGNGSSTGQNAYMPLMTLYTAPLTVVAQVPETDMSSVHDGATASISVTALNLSVSGKVQNTELAAVQSSSTTYYDVTISLDSNDSRLMAGMSAQVTIG